MRVNSGAFPPWKHTPLFEFPAALMKEELPAGDFHIQEERRLFYVALTRAERKLTITTLAEKKGKIPTFIEDILMEPKVKRQDVLQIAPKVHIGADEAASQNGDGAPPSEDLFAAPTERPRIFSRIAGLGGNISSADVRAAHAERFRGEHLPQVPAAILVLATVVAEGRAARHATASAP